MEGIYRSLMRELKGCSQGFFFCFVFENRSSFIHGSYTRCRLPRTSGNVYAPSRLRTEQFLKKTKANIVMSENEKKATLERFEKVKGEVTFEACGSIKGQSRVLSNLKIKE